MKPLCKICKVEMRSDGIALVNPIVYSDDFGNDAGQLGTTCSPSRTHADQKQCWKCPKCGYSREIVEGKK